MPRSREKSVADLKPPLVQTDALFAPCCAPISGAMLSPEEQAEFARATAGVRQAALNALAADRSGTFAIRFIANLQRGVDEVLQAALAAGLKIDCQRGCSHCCSARVDALDPEVLRIAAELKKRPPAALASLTERLREHAARVRGTTAQTHRTPCPMLEQNLCTVYEVRPANCRKAHSLDLSQCARSGATIPQRLDLLLKAEALCKGSADAYSHIGLAAGGHELGQALLLALTDPTAEARWMNGEALFDTIG